MNEASKKLFLRQSIERGEKIMSLLIDENINHVDSCHTLSMVLGIYLAAASHDVPERLERLRKISNDTIAQAIGDYRCPDPDCEAHKVTEKLH